MRAIAEAKTHEWEQFREGTATDFPSAFVGNHQLGKVVLYSYEYSVGGLKRVNFNRLHDIVGW